MLLASAAKGWIRRPMIRRNSMGDLPVVSESSFIDPTAIICGKVRIGDHVFVGPYAVIRADEIDEQGQMEPIVIGAGSNIQDGVVIHSKAGGKVVIGEFTSIAHRAIVHGPCIIGDHVFIGFNAVVFNCEIGAHSVIRHNAVVENCRLPEGFHVPSTASIHTDADIALILRVAPDVTSFSESVALTNMDLVKGYKRIANEL